MRITKGMIRALVLVAVFAASFVGFSALTDTDNVNLTSEMADASLPVVYLLKGEDYIDELYGYRGEMEEASIRGNIAPLSENRVLPLTVQTYQNHIEGISYEVRTMDTSRLLESRQVADYSEKDGVISTQIQFQNLLQSEEEYRLILTLTCDGEEIRYYARIMESESCYVDESIAFVKEFHEKTFDDQEVSSLATYLEPNSEGDNTTLQTVTINSSLSQVAWGDMEGEVLKDPIPAIQEISSSYNTILLRYVYAAVGENGETEFYNVEEYYRLRYSTVSNRIHLLDYQRTMNEIFRGNGDNFSKTSILLGIRDEAVDYLTNEPGTSISFVQEGDLWNYNCNTNQLSLVFSFRGIEGVNDRENNPSHDIRIIKMDESGSTDFVVYGYMNRGEHEGYTGVGVYHYDAVANTVQEEFFVQSSLSYQVLAQNWGKLFYTSDGGDFYMVADMALYRMNLLDKTVEILEDGLEDGSFATSEDGRYIAWQEENGQVTVMDLEGELSWSISGNSGEVLRPIGFVDSDFVYGVSESAASDLMYKVVIVNQQGEMIKEYEKQGCYVTGAAVDESSVLLQRVQKNGDIYTEIDSDTIKSSELEASQNVQADTTYSQGKQTQVKLILTQSISGKAPQLLTPKEVVLEEPNLVSLQEDTEEEFYYVYLGDKIVLSTTDVAAAVQYADEIAGVVTGESQEYIWRRGRDVSKKIATEELPFDVEILSAVQENPIQTLQSVMSQARVLDLTGCDVEQVLYFVNQGSPVFAYGPQGESQLIVGFDQYNVLLYDFETKTTYRKGLSDSEEFFSQAGRRFVSYLPE